MPRPCETSTRPCKNDPKDSKQMHILFGLLHPTHTKGRPLPGIFTMPGPTQRSGKCSECRENTTRAQKIRVVKSFFQKTSFTPMPRTPRETNLKTQDSFRADLGVTRTHTNAVSTHDPVHVTREMRAKIETVQKDVNEPRNNAHGKIQKWTTPEPNPRV